MKKYIICLILLVFCFVTCFAYINMMFSPKGGIQDQIVKRINNSKIYIDVLIYSMTAPKIQTALIDAYKRGVNVRVIADLNTSKAKSSLIQGMEDAGIPIKRMKGLGGMGIMHNKIGVFDGNDMVTGSYNWTSNAENNNWENAVFTNNSYMIMKSTNQFEYMWKK